jgi:hypothetical protein
VKEEAPKRVVQAQAAAEKDTTIGTIGRPTTTPMDL